MNWAERSRIDKVKEQYHTQRLVWAHHCWLFYANYTFWYIKNAKQVGAHIQKICNPFFLSVLSKIKSPRTCIHNCVETAIRSLMFFCISFSVVWVHSLGAQTGILASKNLWICHWKDERICWITSKRTEKGKKNQWLCN